MAIQILTSHAIQDFSRTYYCEDISEEEQEEQLFNSVEEDISEEEGN